MGFSFGTSKRHKEFEFSSIENRTLESVFHECRNAGESGLVVIATNVHSLWVVIRVEATNLGYSCLMKIDGENAYDYDGFKSGNMLMCEIIPAKAIEKYVTHSRSVHAAAIKEHLDRHIASQKIALEQLKERARTESNAKLQKGIDSLEYALHLLNQLTPDSTDQDYIDARQISGEASRYINTHCKEA